MRLGSTGAVSRRPPGAHRATDELSGTTQVPFGGLDRQHAALRDELDAAYARVLRSSGFILGDEVERFEREFAFYCGAKHCVGVASGTAALTLALMAAGIGEGDEVIVPALTFVATAFAVLHAGAQPVFCDVNESDGLLDVAAVERVMSPRTRAIVPVHLYGQLADVSALRDLSSHRPLFVLEDAAQAHGARGESGPAGSMGDAAAFSFYPGKNLGALGDGGAMCTDDPELAAAARRLRDLGRSSHGTHPVIGFNERLDGLQAAFLRAKLTHLDAGNQCRREIAELYRQGLGDRVRMLPERGKACVFHIFPIRTANRDRLRSRLAEAGIETGIHYGVAVHEQAGLAGRLDPAAFPQAEAWAREELSLPIFPELTDREIDHVIEEVTRCAD
jgi:dTDP-4-amino-4,6-dideoxygalactose transaminase